MSFGQSPEKPYLVLGPQAPPVGVAARGKAWGYGVQNRVDCVVMDLWRTQTRLPSASAPSVFAALGCPTGRTPRRPCERGPNDAGAWYSPSTQPGPPAATMRGTSWETKVWASYDPLTVAVRHSPQGVKMIPMEVIAVITPRRRAQRRASGTSSGPPRATSGRESAAAWNSALSLATNQLSRRRWCAADCPCWIASSSWESR